MRELHLFAGAGGGILAGQLLGHRCIGAVEIDPYCQAVLVARQQDGTFPPFPIFPDVCAFDGRPWRGAVDVVAGGFPCQDISVAGSGAGIDGERSGLWREMARIVGEVRPRFVFVENSPALVTRGLGRVLGDLAALGYDCRWTVLGAADVGAPHQRDRFWLVAHAERERSAVGASDGARRALRNVERDDSAQEPGRVELESWFARSGSDVADTAGQRQPQPWDDTDSRRCPPNRAGQAGHAFDVRGWPVEPDMGRMAHGVAHRAHRLAAIGNGQVPRVAAAAFAELSRAFG